MQSIQLAKEFSNEKIQQLKARLADAAVEYPNAAVVVVGSLARREASAESDVDYFIVVDGGVGCEKIKNKLKAAIAAVGLKEPSVGGAFAEVIPKNEFLESIGGREETNDDLTRRMLFLLESTPVMGFNVYEQLFSAVVNAYISEHITHHQLARFFLNDLIRYYRTLCVDFEYKTSDSKKSWGDRNLKLLFARKLLYFSGVLVAAQTAQSTPRFKRSELIRLLQMTPVERVQEVCGSNASSALVMYDKFLGWMSNPETRALLKSTTHVRPQSEDFRDMKSVAHHFSWHLHSLLIATYPPSHPIHQALIL
ncbi:nucleotidyltransferase domain-containing protein [Xanthomonas euroxanthea]|uniref:nucleotidyltransferase domain-containing protein n=1 Tax=Xanthomonas euroxanthea TaxID=2259622 RepID=UPI00162210E8|nr:nucleotidyltransferase domain-containing protein [Xanthomonas euroxanthea]MBB5766713.1 putative nucleotidyltransferase [Xanthomonas euroxanthea]